MIEVKDLKKTYKNFTLGPINFEIKDNGITSLIGPNGSGKSTILMMIGRLLEVDGGSVSVSNKNINHIKSTEFAKILSILSQENNTVTRLTVKQLVSFGRFPYSKGRLNADDEVIISKYIDFLNLKSIENSYLDEISGGQRQRAYIAMILAQETDYVLLDEPLNNLDISSSIQIMEYLKVISSELKRSIFIVLHDINFAIKYSDEICIVKSGEVVSFGQNEKIISSDLLTSVFETKIDIIDVPDYGRVALFGSV